MSKNQSYTVTLQSDSIVSLIKSLSASNLYHNNLDDSEFSYPNEKQEIITRHCVLQDVLRGYLDGSLPSCSCPPETSSLEVDGGILARHALLEESVPVNGSAVPLNLE